MARTKQMAREERKHIKLTAEERAVNRVRTAKAGFLKAEARYNTVFDALVKENEELKTENDQLKAENNQLKAELVVEMKANTNQLKAKYDQLTAECDQLKAENDHQMAEYDQLKAELAVEEEKICESSTALEQASSITMGRGAERQIIVKKEEPDDI